MVRQQFDQALEMKQTRSRICRYCWSRRVGDFEHGTANLACGRLTGTVTMNSPRVTSCLCRTLVAQPSVVGLSNLTR
jgi:hypothetical protein